MRAVFGPHGVTSYCIPPASWLPKKSTQEKEEPSNDLLKSPARQFPKVPSFHHSGSGPPVPTYKSASNPLHAVIPSGGTNDATRVCPPALVLQANVWLNWPWVPQSPHERLRPSAKAGITVRESRAPASRVLVARVNAKNTKAGAMATYDRDIATSGVQTAAREAARWRMPGTLTAWAGHAHAEPKSA